ncbi:hypothetical protein SCHPADRAFT_808945, partial [Schizopora paradoxa]
TDKGVEEWVIEKIIDQRRRGVGFQYLVRWKGYPQEEDRWLPGRELKECEALDVWQQKLEAEKVSEGEG